VLWFLSLFLFLVICSLIHAVQPIVLQPHAQAVLDTLITTLSNRVINASQLPLPRFIQYLFEGFGMEIKEKKREKKIYIYIFMFIYIYILTHITCLFWLSYICMCVRFILPAALIKGQLQLSAQNSPANLTPLVDLFLNALMPHFGTIFTVVPENSDRKGTTP
jgi:hypothetical protein